jgi:hypothetical protein
MRRLASPAVLACLVTLALSTLVTLALPTAVRATGLGKDGACPTGPRRVASHTEIEPTADGRAAGVQFALEPGCDGVDVSLLSYQLAEGRTPLSPPEQVLYDVATTTVSAGRVNRLEVAVLPDCWSLVKLVVGRPPAGETDVARIRAWDRRNTVHSKWRGGQSACATSAPSPLEEDGLLGGLLQGLGDDTDQGGTTDPARTATGTPGGVGRSGERGGEAPARAASGDGPDQAPSTTSGGEAAAAGGTTATTSDAGAAGGQDRRDERAPSGTDVEAAGSRGGQVIAADGALPLTGANALAVLIGGAALVVVGALLLGSGRRYRARHLAS